MSQQIKIPRKRHFEGGFVNFERNSKGQFVYTVMKWWPNVVDGVRLDSERSGIYNGETIEELTKDV